MNKENEMQKVEKVAGFVIEIFPNVKSLQIEWVIYFRDLPFVRATGASLQEARERLAIKWQKTEEAFRDAGLPVPKPSRPRGNRRTLDMIRRLAERKCGSVF
jgi:predicted RNase H-like HicB family nuclease